MKITFKLQALFSVLLASAGLGISLYLKEDMFYNLAWMLIGLLFFINPAYPEKAVRLEEEKAEKGIRIAAMILVYIGLTNGFGV